MELRAPAIPLITIDPYFSIWSFGDRLYDDVTRHWTGSRQSMCGLIKNNGKVYRFLGKVQDSEQFYVCEPDALEQKNLSITPTKTEYIFGNTDIELKVSFFSPLLTNDLLLLSSPVSYIEYEIKGENCENAELYFDICCEACADNCLQSVKLSRTDMGICAGNVEQNVLNRSDDNIRIDWGYLHLLDEEAFFGKALQSRLAFITGNDIEILPEEEEYCLSAVRPVMTVIKKNKHGIIALAYDDIKSIEYFNEKLNAYYKFNGDSFEDVCKKALSEVEDIKKKCEQFDDELIKKATEISDEYAQIISVTYRQAVAAHKLCYDEKGLLFISKECYSNGCAATLDVTYPSMPLFLVLNSELVKAMLRPIFEYAQKEEWSYDFTPHDVGQYPLLNGQVYGKDLETGIIAEDMQMPIEECGNILIAVYAVCKYSNDFSYAHENETLLKKWGNYLSEYGYDPANQLCTDDFCGHLAHNCNLSIKGIIGLYICGELFGIEEYKEKAKEYAKRWEENALEEDHYKLAFDLENSYSIKYNIIWDKLFSFNIFDNDIFDKESKYYEKIMFKYGIQLDSRSTIAKNDWIMWAAVLSDDKQYRDKIIHSLWNMINETKQRVPLTDRFDAATGEQIAKLKSDVVYGFSNRTVVGGFAILLLEKFGK